MRRPSQTHQRRSRADRWRDRADMHIPLRRTRTHNLFASDSAEHEQLEPRGLCIQSGRVRLHRRRQGHCRRGCLAARDPAARCIRRPPRAHRVVRSCTLGLERSQINLRLQCRLGGTSEPFHARRGGAGRLGRTLEPRIGEQLGGTWPFAPRRLEHGRDEAPRFARDARPFGPIHGRTRAPRRSAVGNVGQRRVAVEWEVA